MITTLRGLSLTANPVGWVLGAAVALAVAYLVWRGRSLRRLLVATVVAVAVVVVGRHLLPASIDVARIPPLFYLWIGVVLAVVGLVVGTWRSASRFWRFGGVATVVVALAFTLQQADAWFAYYPTVADLVRAPLPDQASLAQLQSAGRAARFPDGAIVPVDLPATSSGFRHRRALVWVPPAALAGPGSSHQFGDGGRRPVVMLLAGTPGAPDDMLRAGNFARVAARYAATHNGDAPLLVLPDHNGGFGADSECVGWHGQAETYLTQDVPAAMAAQFGARQDHWGVIGYSEGGTCALMLALRHPDQFPTFVDIGGDERPNLGSTPGRDRVASVAFYAGSPLQADLHNPRYLLEHGHYTDVHGWFVAGRADRPALQAAAGLAPAAVAAGVDLRWTTPPGHHSFSLVNAVSDETFSWVVAHLPQAPAENPA